MPVVAAVGQTLVGLDELNDVAANNAADVQKLIDEPAANEKLLVQLGNDRSLGTEEFAKAREVKSTANPYEGIGIGKPLTIIIETIYIGDYPDAWPWVPGFNGGDVLVTSAHKAFEVFDRAPRAVHMLEAKAKRRTMLEATAAKQGSQLAYYSPAVTEFSILFTVELSADREFNEAIGAAFAKAVIAAGALPVFAPAAPFLVAAGTAIPIAASAASALSRPHTFFEETVSLDFDRPGVALAQPGALVLYHEGADEALANDFKLGEGFRLRHVKTGKEYKGPSPYVVLSLDGAPRPSLESWSAEAASASLIERFHEPDELTSKALELMTESLSLYNDMSYRAKAAEELERAKATKGPQKKQHEVLYAAYLKNIKSAAIRATVETA